MICLVPAVVLLAATAISADLATLEGALCAQSQAGEAIPLVRAGAAKGPPCGSENGFVIRTVKARFTDDWGYDEMNKLLDFGCTGPLCMGPGMSVPGVEQGSRISEFVNLYDSGSRGIFNADNGHADESYPGVDPFESPPGEPAAADDDDHFATEILAIIHLDAGLHLIGAHSEDGTVIEVGGIEIGRTGQLRKPANADFIFAVEQEGYYTFRARSFAAESGASLELHELVRDSDGVWHRVLLGDVVTGGSAAFVPEPMTVALLALGALSPLRRRK
jgi:hypothetical protein